MAELGTDFYCIDDLDANLSVVDGRVGLAQAAIRRISTPKFGLHYDGDYGYDVRDELGKPQGQHGRLSAHRIEIEVLKDERVNDAKAEVEFVAVADSADQQNDALTIDVKIADDDGPFELVAIVGSDGITMELLEGTI
jgi:hypothetical protein